VLSPESERITLVLAGLRQLLIQASGANHAPVIQANSVAQGAPAVIAVAVALVTNNCYLSHILSSRVMPGEPVSRLSSQCRLIESASVNVPFSVARYAESSQALVSYWRIPGRRLRNFAWLHVEPRPVPELAWGGKLVTRAVPGWGFRREGSEF
jgi:hypothetical protein